MPNKKKSKTARRKFNASRNPILNHKDQNEVFFYFYHLNNNSLSAFESNWNKIKFCHEFEGKQLAIILHSIAVHLITHPNKDTQKRRSAVSYLVNNSSDLLDIIKQSKNVSGDRICLMLWSVAVLNSQFPQTDFALFYKKLRDQIQSTDKLSQENLNQLRQTDLWFTGSSSVSEVHPQKAIQNKNEFILARHFQEAGILAVPINFGVIPNLSRAIDILAARFDKKGEVLIELDGSSHFVNGPEQPDGSIEYLARISTSLQYNANTLFQAALRHRLAPEEKILHIDYAFYRALRKVKDQSSNKNLDLKCLRALFDKTLESPPGVFRAVMGPDLITDMIQRCPDGKMPILEEIPPAIEDYPSEETNENDTTTHTAETGAERFKNKFGGLGF